MSCRCAAVFKIRLRAGKFVYRCNVAAGNAVGYQNRHDKKLTIEKAGKKC